MSTLKDKTIVVTGANGIAGNAMVNTTINKGAKVIAIDYADMANTNPQVSCYGGADLTDTSTTSALFNKIAEEHGSIHGLVNIAGGFCWETLAGSDLSNWGKMFQINVMTAVNATSAALPHLAEQNAKIVSIGANGATKAGAGFGPYAASKAGVAKLTESLAEELKPKGICVNAVLPSVIDTPTNRKDMPDEDFSTWVTPEKLSEVLCFLLSDEADAITGSLIPVTGKV